MKRLKGKIVTSEEMFGWTKGECYRYWYKLDCLSVQLMIENNISLSGDLKKVCDVSWTWQEIFRSLNSSEFIWKLRDYSSQTSFDHHNSYLGKAKKRLWDAFRYGCSSVYKRCNASITTLSSQEFAGGVDFRKLIEVPCNRQFTLSSAYSCPW